MAAHLADAASRAYEAITDGHAPASLRPWLFRVVHNLPRSIASRRVLCLAVLVGLSLTGAGASAHAAFPGGNGKIAWRAEGSPGPRSRRCRGLRGPQGRCEGHRECFQVLHLQEADHDQDRQAHGQEEGETAGERAVGGNASLSGSRRSTTVRIF